MLSSELLGSPSGARLLIINADDFGMDIDHLKWLSGERFPGFLSRAGLLPSIPVLANVVRSEAQAYRGLRGEGISAFGVVGQLLPMGQSLVYGPGHGA